MKQYTLTELLWILAQHETPAQMAATLHCVYVNTLDEMKPKERQDIIELHDWLLSLRNIGEFYSVIGLMRLGDQL